MNVWCRRLPSEHRRADAVGIFCGKVEGLYSVTHDVTSTKAFHWVPRAVPSYVIFGYLCISGRLVSGLRPTFALCNGLSSKTQHGMPRPVNQCWYNEFILGQQVTLTHCTAKEHILYFRSICADSLQGIQFGHQLTVIMVKLPAIPIYRSCRARSSAICMYMSYSW